MYLAFKHLGTTESETKGDDNNRKATFHFYIIFPKGFSKATRPVSRKQRLTSKVAGNVCRFMKSFISFLISSGKTTATTPASVKMLLTRLFNFMPSS